MTTTKRDWGKVMIGLRLQPSMPSWTTVSLMGLIQHGLRPGDRWDFVYSKTMHRAANDLVRRLLKSECDTLCFIDSDAVFGTAALEELRADPDGQICDVLQAFTVKRGWPPEPMYLVEFPDQPGAAAKRGNHFITQLPLDPQRVYPAGAVSLHFTLVRRELLERMVSADGPEHTYWFEYSRDQGEDITFSLNARAAGAVFGMSTKLKVGHVSDVITGWDTMIDYYDRKFRTEAGEPPASAEGLMTHFSAQHSLASLVAEFTGEPVEQVMLKANTGAHMVADHWRRAQPADAAAVRAFYGEAGEYLYDLVRWNSAPAFQRLLRTLAGVKGETILEIGGGLGTVTEFLATRGNAVDYYDLPGPLLDFAAWRFGRLNGHGGNIRIMRADSSWRPSYDRVVAFDVLEHVHPDEFGGLMAEILGSLRQGGTLTAHNSWENSGGLYPQHFNHSARWDALVRDHGLICVDDLNWRKP
jgi:2-polyprenyl-3-methyl-5-hydroxy-6-metoxy-1,4-benzoquinol methylase